MHRLNRHAEIPIGQDMLFEVRERRLKQPISLFAVATLPNPLSWFRSPAQARLADPCLPKLATPAPPGRSSPW